MLGTQGGTFVRQRENPFNRARRSQIGQDINNSSDNSSDSEQSFVTTDDGNNAGESSNVVPVFMVSETHSINGKLARLFYPRFESCDHFRRFLAIKWYMYQIIILVAYTTHQYHKYMRKHTGTVVLFYEFKSIQK